MDLFLHEWEVRLIVVSSSWRIESAQQPMGRGKRWHVMDSLWERDHWLRPHCQLFWLTLFSIAIGFRDLMNMCPSASSCHVASDLVSGFQLGRCLLAVNQTRENQPFFKKKNREKITEDIN